MAKVTTIYFDGFTEEGFQIFRETKGFPLVIKSCNNGIVNLYISKGTSIRYLSDVLEGCFNEKSNFIRQLSNFFDISTLQQINFVFNGIEVSVTEENADRVFYVWQDSLKTKQNKEKISQTI